MRPYPLSCDALVDDLLQDLDALTDEVRGRFGALSAEQLAWQPSPTRWGVGHCLVHLAKTNELYREALASAFRTAQVEGRSGRALVRGGWFGRWFTGAVGPSMRIRAKAPRSVRPPQGAPEAGSLENFLTEQQRARGLIEDARGLDLDAVRIHSPFSRLLRFRAGDALRIVVEHEKRHVKQAVAVLGDPAFPA
jgi:hypothetical protein